MKIHHLVLGFCLIASLSTPSAHAEFGADMVRQVQSRNAGNHPWQAVTQPVAAAPVYLGNGNAMTADGPVTHMGGNTYMTPGGPVTVLGAPTFSPY